MIWLHIYSLLLSLILPSSSMILPVSLMIILEPSMVIPISSIILFYYSPHPINDTPSLITYHTPSSSTILSISPPIQNHQFVLPFLSMIPSVSSMILPIWYQWNYHLINDTSDTSDSGSTNSKHYQQRLSVQGSYIWRNWSTIFKL